MDFDVGVIGAGPSGYSCAKRLAELGKKVALIEKYSELGGTCLNVGCIPSKALLDSSELFYRIKNSSLHGISCSNVDYDLKKMIERKSKIVKDMSESIKFLMKKNKISVFKGIASFKTESSILVVDNESSQTITSKYFVIATGSKPSELPFIKIDKKKIISSTEALNLTEVPKELVIIGAGAIGLELASIFARLNSKVKIIEYFDRPIPMIDIDLGRMIQRILERELKIEFFLSHKVVGSHLNSGVTIKAVDSTGKEKEIFGDLCIICVGRSPYTKFLELDKIGINKDEKGRIIVDSEYATSVPNIFAIGDVIKGPMLAHKAEKEGLLVAENICGKKSFLNYDLIPSVVYTSPEVASIGKMESELEKNSYKSLKLPLRANGRANAGGEKEGIIKVLMDIKDRKLLGVHIVSPHGSDIISEAALALKYNASVDDISKLIHPHPTYSEIFRDVCSLAI